MTDPHCERVSPQDIEFFLCQGEKVSIILNDVGSR